MTTSNPPVPPPWERGTKAGQEQTVSREASTIPPPPLVPTDLSPMNESKPDRADMTDRELLIEMLEKQDKMEGRVKKIEDRLSDGDGLFSHLEATSRSLDSEVGMCIRSIQTLCTLAGADDAAGQLAAYIKEKRDRYNGSAAFRDEKTNPGTDG